MEKKGRVTIFIIVAVAVVALGVLVYLFFPEIKSALSGSSTNPQTFISECLEEEIEDAVEILSLQGGSIEPEFYTLYEDNPVEYLCYTNEYYSTCVVQQPMLRAHIEAEIEEEIADDVEYCFNSLEESYETRGYDVILEEGLWSVSLKDDQIVSVFNYSLTLTKDGTEKYESFSVVLNNNLYELVMIASNIVQWESTYGDADTYTYMAYYPNLKVEKATQSDGTDIYILSDINTGDMFQFATRGLVWPPGVSYE